MIEVEGTTQPGPRPAEGDENGPADIIDGYRRACVELDDLLAQAGDVELQPDLETGGATGGSKGNPISERLITPMTIPAAPNVPSGRTCRRRSSGTA